MATKKIRLPVSIGIVDEEKSRPERLDEKGRLVQEAVTVTKIVPAGTPVTLDAEEADKLLAKFGPYTERVVITEGEVPGVVAPASPPVTNARRP